MAEDYKIIEILQVEKVSTFTQGITVAKVIENDLLNNREIVLDFSETKYHTSLFFNGIFDELLRKEYDLHNFKSQATLTGVAGGTIANMNRSLNNGIATQDNPEYKRTLDENFEQEYD